MSKNPRRSNFLLMLILWIFAVGLTALVLILMNLRGPMTAPRRKNTPMKKKATRCKMQSGHGIINMPCST